MYSKKARLLLKKSGIEIGDRVRLEQNERVFEGLLMPRAGESSDFVIKLDSGYNIGISSNNARILLIKKAEKKQEQMETEIQTKRGDIVILGCGGTILSKVEYKTGAVFPAYSPKDLFNAFPKLKQMASIHSRILFQLFSEDIHILHWSKIAQEIADEIKQGAKGVVILHGTDTLHYTSAALSFALQDLPVPVVVTAAQRSSDRPSSDNENNLLNSIFAAKSDIAHVGICMHANSSDDFAYFHLGTKVRKMHSSRRDAFLSINSLPLAKIDYKTEKLEPLIPYNKRNTKKNLDLQNKFSQNVGMLYIHPGIKPELIDKFADYDGLVLVGTGFGHIPTNPSKDKCANTLVPNIKALIDSGIPVVMSSQTIFGRINMNVYSTGRLLQEIGVIGNNADWTPETAYVKLCWVLGKEKNQKKVNEIMMKNIAGELSERIIYKEKFVDF